MRQSSPRPSPEQVARVRAMAERRLSAEEFAAYVEAPMTDEERDGILSLVDWFSRRYPTPLDRLVAGRRAWANAARRMRAGGVPPP